ncbi:hypothetical protein EG834_00245 [bacterium]|nr:hypothetical protein [bacterium]
MTPKRTTELKAVKLLKNFSPLKKEFIIDDISQKHGGPDLICISKKNPKKMMFIEVKGMKNAHPQAFRLYKTYRDYVATGEYYVAIICNIQKEPALYIIEGSAIKKWHGTKKSKQKNCFTINQVRDLVEKHTSGPHKL